MNREKIDILEMKGFGSASDKSPECVRRSEVVVREDETSYYCPECLNYFMSDRDTLCPYCGSDSATQVIAHRANEDKESESVQYQYTDFNDLLWHGEFDAGGIQVIRRFAETHGKDEIKELCNNLSRYGYENNISVFSADEVKAFITD